MLRLQPFCRLGIQIEEVFPGANMGQNIFHLYKQNFEKFRFTNRPNGCSEARDGLSCYGPSRRYRRIEHQGTS